MFLTLPKIFRAAALLTVLVAGRHAAIACPSPNEKSSVVEKSQVAPTERSQVATAKQPAQIWAEAGPEVVSRSAALTLTLRPTAADPNAPYLAEVFAKNLCDGKGMTAEQFLGTVAFFPVKVGEPQDFTFAAPQQGFPAVAPRNVELTVKLVPANPKRKLTTASVEVLNARFIQ